ncbi:hypothetical protein KIN20_021257 [Parelaphostrongylus tenuis]|uniref:SCP domain-containing protein n=1 Tax=Parelaphostrongylus tenuis TaxID=148309 RepID=A0AAD5QRH4_PARTN|nr:hypothetical protein KIN20_021257 [Parelaphostrongylus tenuis]
MTDALRNSFLDMHNFYRSVVATGRAVDKIDEKAPQAAAMPKLKYDCELEALAAKTAKVCPPKEISDGVNIFGVALPKFDKRIIAELATETWFEQLEKFGIGKENIVSWKIARRPTAVLYYTQMVWQETKHIGCSIRDCPRATYAVCTYREPGTRVGVKIYETGEPCTKCPTGEQCNPTEGLCFS